MNQADDDPGWTTCGRCGEPVPNDTSGRPYSHTCKGKK
jgi:hypothetical protein